MPLVLNIEDYGTPMIVAEHMDESAMASLDLSEPIYRILLDIMRIERVQFESEGRRGGGSWKKLAPSTITKKGHGMILRDKDELINSVTEPGAPHQILEVYPEGFAFGTTRDWAEVHQYGSDRVPRRPFLRFLPSDAAKWSRWLGDHITNSFREPTL